jgi:sulfopyruvate decarboxylase subunit beta
MKRDEALEILAAVKDEGVSVATMRAIPDWYAVGGAPDLNLDNRGCMGAAAALGLGIALAQPQRRVMVIDGDGSLLMQLGGLATIAGSGAANFYHVVLVNGVYETSGFQPIPAADKVDFPAMALGAGYEHAYEFGDPAVLRERLASVLDRPGPALIAIRVGPDELRKDLPQDRPIDPAGVLRDRLLGRG